MIVWKLEEWQKRVRKESSDARPRDWQEFGELHARPSTRPPKSADTER